MGLRRWNVRLSVCLPVQHHTMFDCCCFPVRTLAMRTLVWIAGKRYYILQ